MARPIRNLAIVAHVDHGKTTLVDKLLRQTGAIAGKTQLIERVMDSNNLERERGITIFAKHAEIRWKGCKINLIDTPGHADFGGEVERVLSMADGFLLLVDATDGPMPQTRFVTQKAFSKGLKPLVVLNKIDRDTARPGWALDQTFDLFLELEANEEQLNFPVLYASALHGTAGRDPNALADDLSPLLDAILEQVPPPTGDPDKPLQMQLSQLEYSSYTGVLGIGRILHGRLKLHQSVAIADPSGGLRTARVEWLYGQSGLSREPIEEAEAGDIVSISGVGDLHISDTVCDPQTPLPIPALEVDEPTVSIRLSVNTSPFAGREGKWLTSRQIWDRLVQEKRHNVALQVQQTADPDTFLVSGRGELHLSVLIETMRREGFEMSVSRPKVIFKQTDRGTEEPFEELVLDLPVEMQGPLMCAMGERRATLVDMKPDGRGRIRLLYEIASRALIGFRNAFLTMTSGNGLMFSRFLRYDLKRDAEIADRPNGVLISNSTGKALGYALFHLQPRGTLFIGHGEEVYEGQIIGLHSRSNDLTVNCLQGKKLSNVRASGKDAALTLSPPLRMSLEQSLEFIADDELLEVTPNSLRLRKRHLTESDRKRYARSPSA